LAAAAVQADLAIVELGLSIVFPAGTYILQYVVR
jgi:hypothetical protein